MFFQIQSQDNNNFWKIKGTRQQFSNLLAKKISLTAPKIKTLFNSAKDLNKF